MYYLGIDLGTSSVGWAVTDKNYQLLRKKGKDMWGVRLFDEAESAQGRRTHRISRRRREREIARIGLVKEYFADEICKVDPGFYQRLEESKYHREDKSVKDKYAIFADKDYCDKDYYEQYPTIFHLRKELIESTEPHDIRLVYLAILNLFKHRGHFLNAYLDDANTGTDFEELYAQLLECIPEGMDISLPRNISTNKITAILEDKELTRTEKVEKLLDVFQIVKAKDKKTYEVIKMICGLSGKMETLFGKDSLGEQSRLQLSFRDQSYEEKMMSLAEVLSDENIQMINALKEMHDAGFLLNLLKGCQYLSQARVQAYYKHQIDLVKMKAAIKKYAIEDYDAYFRIMSENNYSSYVGTVNSGKEKVRRNRKASIELFVKETKRLLEKMPQDDADVIYLKRELEKGELFPKQNVVENRIIPNQIHLRELKAILKNAEQYAEFLKEKDDSGLTVSERIIQLFQFQIPYYVGPVHIGGAKSENQWVVRQEGDKGQGKILPWNLEEKIDLPETRKAFIDRMVRHCTYLSGEKVLPKGALMYERYMVLNELNTVRINGEKLPVSVKQDIYHVLFKKGKNVSLKQLTEYLVSNGLVKKNEQIEVSGLDGTFQHALTSYGRFYNIFGSDIELWENQQIAEQIVFWGTVYGNDKKLMKELLVEKYGSKSKYKKLTEEQIKRIVGFKWSDWGRLSKEFLGLTGCAKSDGVIRGLLEAMWETQDNLMELLSSRYTYIETLQEKSEGQQKLLSEFTYEDLRDSYMSAPVKRMTWQTLLILKEICQVMGENPERVFVEMPREHGEKGKRTVSRKRKFEELYKNCKGEERQWQKELADIPEGRFRSKKLYLYYTQKGRCMYSGEPIALEDLFNDRLYDIDHIYPRHFIKDDSLDNNLVLVKTELNGHKKDHYPLEEEVRKGQVALWKTLLDGNFITKEKYSRLIRNWGFTDEEKAGFINRQIVETGQATKGVAGLLKELLPQSEIVYVKAGNVSDFRRKYDMLKARAVNDLHHAQDAYLNIVVGNAYFVKFTRNPLNFILNNKMNPQKYPYHMDKIFDYDIIRGEEVAWTVGEVKTITKVRQMMQKQTPLITKRVYEAHGGISDETIYSAKEAKKENYIPIKESDKRLEDVTKYGGFSSVTVAYYFLVEHTKKKKRIRTLERLPLYLKTELEKNTEILVKYCVERLGLVQPRICVQKVPFKSLIRRNGYFLRLGGSSEKQILVENAMPLYLPQNWCNYVKHMENFKNNGHEEDIRQIVTKESNMELYQILLCKHCDAVYSEKPNPIGAKMLEKKQAFSEIALKEQVDTLLELLKVTQSQNLSIDAKAIGLKASAAKMGNEVTAQESFLLVNQSVTGLFTKTIDLKTI